VVSSLEISIVTTGNELVEASATPEPGQIRNSNGPMLVAQIREAGCVPRFLGTASDDVKVLERMIADGLESDVLLVTGGVSMGELDLVEGVFARLGVHAFFDKVAIKPGKPTVFGRCDNTLVFGLPGNPVSALTVFEILVRPALRKRMGFADLHLPRVRATLTTEFHHRSGREDYHPAWTRCQEDRFTVEALPTHGSADLVAFARSNSYLVVPREVEVLKAGSEVEVVLRREYWQ
jgi:molybdopterin molybdotransferase